MSPEFIELIKQFGIRGGIALFIVYMLYRGWKNHLYPALKKLATELIDNYKAQQKELNEARIKTFNQLGGFAQEAATAARVASEKDDQVLEGMRLITQEIRENVGQNAAILEGLQLITKELSEVRDAARQRRRKDVE